MLKEYTHWVVCYQIITRLGNGYNDCSINQLTAFSVTPTTRMHFFFACDLSFFFACERKKGISESGVIKGHRPNIFFSLPFFSFFLQYFSLSLSLYVGSLGWKAFFKLETNTSIISFIIWVKCFPFTVE